MKKIKYDTVLKVSVKFLRWFCPEPLIEEIEGDLIQKLNRDVETFGKSKAKRRFVWNVIRFFRPGIVLRSRFSFELNQAYMVRNYFKIAYRNLMKHRSFSLINMLGVVVGITAFLLIVQYVSFERSFDKFHVNGESIYRVALLRYGNGNLQQASAKTFVGIQSLLKNNFPDVECFTGFYKTPANTGFLFRYNGKIYNEPGGVLNPDSSFFRVFPSLLLRGDPESVLSQKQNLVISESMAKKIFGDEDPIGQPIERIDDYDEGSDFIITGVLKDLPENAHFHASFIRHIDDSWPDRDNWKEGFLYTYISISKDSDPKKIEDRLNTLLSNVESEYPDVKGSTTLLQPLTDIHLTSDFIDELESNGNQNLVIILSIIGFIVLAMAWINYVNLQTTRVISRYKEVGVRRIIGSGKADLVLQFLIEYLIIVAGAVLVATMLLYLIYPYYSSITGVPLQVREFFTLKVWSIALAIFVFGSFVVGVYPGLFLLKLNPVKVLKGTVIGLNQGLMVRRIFVVFQFTASLVLIAYVLVISKQLDFMRVTNKGVDVEHVIALRNPTAYSNQELELKHNEYEAFENILLDNTAFKEVASSSAIPGTEIGFSYINLIKRNPDDPYDPTIYKTLFVNSKFIPAYGLKLLAGHNFPRSNTGVWTEPWEDENWTSIILNESAIHQLGFQSPQDAIDQIVNFQLFDEFLKYKIIGVVEDYHHESVKKEIYPTILANNYNTFQQVYYSVRLNSGTNPSEALPIIQNAWEKIFPDRPFEYFFIDDYYDQQFKSESHFGIIFTFFAGVAIFIACLGIFGMTLFEANTRLKEISIRKILGASVSNVVALLFHDHVCIVLLSACLSLPLIYYLTNEWLSSYPIRIDFSVIFFLAPIGVILLMVVCTSCFQSIKAANTNPVNNLKHD